MTFGLFIENKKYNQVRHIREIFTDSGMFGFKGYVRRERYEVDNECDEKTFAFEGFELSRYMIARSVCYRNVDALDFLIKDSGSVEVRLYALINLLNLFHGCYIADRRATNSDFWNLVLNAQIDDRTFLSFHVLHYVYHMGAKIIDSDTHTDNLSGVLSMIKGASFYEEDKILETRAFQSKLIDKLEGILNSGVFDESLKAFHAKFDRISDNKEINKSAVNLCQYLVDSFATSWSHETTLLVEKLETFID